MANITEIPRKIARPAFVSALALGMFGAGIAEADNADNNNSQVESSNQLQRPELPYKSVVQFVSRDEGTPDPIHFEPRFLEVYPENRGTILSTENARVVVQDANDGIIDVTIDVNGSAQEVVCEEEVKIEGLFEPMVCETVGLTNLIPGVENRMELGATNGKGENIKTVVFFRAQ